MFIVRRANPHYNKILTFFFGRRGHPNHFNLKTKILWGRGDPLKSSGDMLLHT